MPAPAMVKVAPSCRVTVGRSAVRVMVPLGRLMVSLPVPAGHSLTAVRVVMALRASLKRH